MTSSLTAPAAAARPSLVEERPAAAGESAARQPKAHIAHVSLPAKNPASLAAFYQELFTMEIVGGGENGAAVFLASDPAEESHDLAFSRDPGLAHIAFKVTTLSELIALYRVLRARGSWLLTQNHGVSLAVYVRDPEGNLVEVYWPTGRTDFYLPVIRPLDLDLPEAELLRIVREQPSNTRQPDA